MLRRRYDSFVVTKDVHYPTDVSLLQDGVRCDICISIHLVKAT